MKGSWPKVSASWGGPVRASHSLPFNPVKHEHDFLIHIGWTHEINPRHGHSGFPLDKIDRMFLKLAALIQDKNLNDLMPFPPTAENLAVWLLVRCPGFIDFVQVQGYGEYVVRVERSGLRSEMVAAYLNGDSVLELTV